jgi:hypothetical protein
MLPLHTWRTREDPFTEVWEEIRGMLSSCAGFEAKTLFEYLQRRTPEKFSDGSLPPLAMGATQLVYGVVTPAFAGAHCDNPSHFCHYDCLN